MKTVTLEEAQSHLAELVESAAGGDSFLITREGKPLVSVASAEALRSPQRFGWMPGPPIPEDFDTMCQKEIEEMFYGEE